MSTPESLMKQELEDDACALMHLELLNKVERRLKDHSDGIEGQLREMNLNLTNLTGAFVTGRDGKPDITGHRSAHESMIEAAKAERDFWIEMKRDLMKKGIMGLIVVIMGLIIVGIQVKLGIIRVGT